MNKRNILILMAVITCISIQLQAGPVKWGIPGGDTNMVATSGDNSVEIDLRYFQANAQISNDTWFEDLRTNRVDSDSSIVWKQFGPGMSGNNYRIYWHPTDPKTVFLGPNMGNVYRSTDMGTTYEGILDDDDKGYAFNNRGPIEINSPDFSRQDPDFGFCSREAKSLLYVTYDCGQTWSHHSFSDSVWGDKILNSIVVDPTNDNIWYVGSGNASDINTYYYSFNEPHGTGAASGHEAKIWKTINKGDSWIDVTPDINPSAQIIRLIVHPETPNVVFAATTYGFYKTTDAGTNWELKTTGFDHNIIRSLDMHYNKTTGQVTLFAIDLVKWAASGSTIVNDGGGVFRSIDEGENWHNINGDLGVDVFALADDDYTFRTAYYNAMNKWFGVDNAQTLYPVYPSHLLHSYSMVKVDPIDVNKIFVLNDYKHYGGSRSFRGGMLWRTDDGGTHWIATLRNGTAWEGKHVAYWQGRGNPTFHNMELRAQSKWSQRDSYERKAGGRLAFNCDSSMIMFQWAKVLCVSTDGGDTWIENDEIEATSSTENWVASGNSNLPGHGIFQDARLPDTLYLPSGENDLWINTHDGGNVRSGAQAVRRIPLGSGEYSCSSVALHSNDPNTIYTLQFRQAQAGKLLKSINGGQTFSEIGTALQWPDGYSTNDSIHQLCLTIAPDNPDNMYFCVPLDPFIHGFTWKPSPIAGIRKSSDGGLTWDWANTGLPASLDVVGLRLDPGDSSKLYACVYGSGGGLYVSTDYASTWTKHSTFPSNIESVSDLHFSSDGKIYVSCGRHSDTDWQNGGVWVSDDEGLTWTQLFKTHWTRMTKTATYDPNVILVQMNSKGTIDIVNPGTFLSKDGGITWTKINKGNPQSDRINDIAVDQVLPDVYYVSTQGCGWLRADKIDPNNVPPVFANQPIERETAPGQTFLDTIDGEASDANGDAISYLKIYGPDWLSVGPDGTLSGVVPGEIEFPLCIVQADDGNGASTRELMNLFVWDCVTKIDAGEILDSDFSGELGIPDCYIDIYDLRQLAQEWLDLYDLTHMATLAGQWLQCNDPENSDCSYF